MSNQKTDDIPFWRRKRLCDMSRAEWESLCDGCGKCCLNKLEDDDGAITYTNVACRLLDVRQVRCTRYAQRQRLVPDCVVLTPKRLKTLHWMPSTCAYRLLAEGRDLPAWHPLLSGHLDSVHKAGMSVQGKAVSEIEAGPLEHHQIDWIR
ncbi:MAG: YcgN family cysteine cluster protein [Pseudomonadota bacterium]